MARLRYNGLQTTLGAALTGADVTITFAAALTHAGGTAVPTITGTDYIPLTILDLSGNVAEIVSLTAYTSGATTGTIARAQESTTATAHASGATVVHGLTVADVTTLAGAGVVAWCSTAQSIPNVTNTVIPFDSESFDTNAFHDPVTNPSRLTVPAGYGGKYIAMGQIRYAANATGVRVAAIRKNGATYISNTPIPNAGADQTGVPTFAPVPLVAGDYVELVAYHSAGAALATAVSGSNVYTWLSLTRVGD